MLRRGACAQPTHRCGSVRGAVLQVGPAGGSPAGKRDRLGGVLEGSSQSESMKVGGASVNRQHLLERRPHRPAGVSCVASQPPPSSPGRRRGPPRGWAGPRPGTGLAQLPPQLSAIGLPAEEGRERGRRTQAWPPVQQCRNGVKRRSTCAQPSYPPTHPALLPWLLLEPKVLPSCSWQGLVQTPPLPWPLLSAIFCHVVPCHAVPCCAALCCAHPH